MPFKDPEVKKAHQRAYVKKRRAIDPAYKERSSSHNKTPDGRAKAKVYNARPEIKEREQKRKQTSKYKQKARHRLYGISPEDQQALFEKQNGCCGICESPLEQFSKRCQMDHDHVTGEVRGFLCTRCNTNLDFMESNRDAMDVYLARSAELQKKKGH